MDDAQLRKMLYVITNAKTSLEHMLPTNHLYGHDGCQQQKVIDNFGKFSSRQLPSSQNYP